MAHQQYKIEIVTDPKDFTPWTAVQYASFQGTDNVCHDVLFPPAHPAPTPTQLDVSVQRHIESIRTDPEHNIYIQITDPTNGKVMGGAKWQLWPHDPHRPQTHPITFIDDSTEQGRIEKEYAQRVMDDFQGSRAKNMGMPHGLLDICFTAPEYERRGVASALVNWGLKKCDEEGWVAFTEASVRGAPVYERLGFEKKEAVKLRYDEMGEYAKNMGDIAWILMKRPAKTKT